MEPTTNLEMVTSFGLLSELKILDGDGKWISIVAHNLLIIPLLGMNFKIIPDPQFSDINIEIIKCMIMFISVYAADIDGDGDMDMYQVITLMTPLLGIKIMNKWLMVGPVDNIATNADGVQIAGNCLCSRYG